VAITWLNDSGDHRHSRLKYRGDSQSYPIKVLGSGALTIVERDDHVC
jgi:hypothetical protein